MKTAPSGAPADANKEPCAPESAFEHQPQEIPLLFADDIERALKSPAVEVAQGPSGLLEVLIRGFHEGHGERGAPPA
jgi:hypothetical protein